MMNVVCASLQKGFLLLVTLSLLSSQCMAIKLKIRDEECLSYHIDAYAAFYGECSIRSSRF